MFGDIVLSQAGKVLSQLFRSSDIVGRLGGDEFHGVYAQCSLSGAGFAQSKGGCATPSPSCLNRIKGVFCSVGVSCCPEDGRSYEELYRRADKALYAAKTMAATSLSFTGR